MKLNHLAIPYLAVLAFIFGGLLTSGGVDWYQTLVLPSWHPSTGIIALVWAVIYVFVAWSLLILWNKTPHDKRFKLVMAGFAVAALVNFVWSIIFFQLHMLALAVWCALLLGVLTLSLAVLIYPRSKKAALLLAPYIAWVSFAAYLNHAVAVLNP